MFDSVHDHTQFAEVKKRRDWPIGILAAP